MAKQVQDNIKFTGIRLPTNIKPTHYDLRLKPDLINFTFEGQVQIQYEFSGPSAKSIVLHSDEIVISSGTLEADGSTHPLTTVYYSQESEAATLEFNSCHEIPPSGNIKLNFSGTLNDQLRGFYRTSFKVKDSIVYAATTMFAATDARRCFPCWDEPNIKATFSVTLVTRKFVEAGGEKHECLALSNMDEVSRLEKGDQGEVEVQFAKTPIMSTYLLAFVVGPFEAIQGSDGRRPIRVFTTPGKKQQGQFALEVACKSLAYYEDYFNIPYALPKMDLIAIPDFACGAMENWGLVTYRETCLLVDGQNSSTKVKQRVAITVAHELAHQWFGNLVTMEWWTHIWLNEGFATFMSFLCIDQLFAQYDIWSNFVTDSYMSALELDSLDSSHPIEIAINHSSEVGEIFDQISYNKGASLIRMLHNYIGDEAFRQGMNSYLIKFSYRNASTEDLWDCLGLASNKPVRDLMLAWTKQKGYPWLSLSNNKISQSKFTADGKVAQSGGWDIIWMVPLMATVSDQSSQIKQLGLVKNKSFELQPDDIPGDKWIKFNPGAIGLYRFAYDEKCFKRLPAAIIDHSLSKMDRLDIQNDYFALCLAGKVSFIQLLELLIAYKHETDYAIWSSIDSCLSRLDILLMGSDSRALLHQFGLKLYEIVHNKLGMSASSSDDHKAPLTRALVINRLVAFGGHDVIEMALKKFSGHISGAESIPADLRAAIYKAVSIHGDSEAFESLFKLYRSTELSEERVRVAAALGSASPGERLNKVIEFVLSDELRVQDKCSVLMPMGLSHPPHAWKFLQDQRDFLREKCQSSFLLQNILKCTTENFATEAKATEIGHFFERNKFPGAERTIQQSVERIRVNANWLELNREQMKESLEQVNNQLE